MTPLLTDFATNLTAVGGFITAFGTIGLAVYKALPKKAPKPTTVQQTSAEVEVIRFDVEIA